MPVAQCQTCGYVIIDPSNPCPSCGNMNAQSLVQSTDFNDDSDDNDDTLASGLNVGASAFNFGVVLSRSFSTFFRHSFVLVGLCLLSQLLGLVTTLLTRTQPGLINTIFGLAIQGAVIYGVYDALQGNSVYFGRSLSKGLERSWPLFKASIGLGLCSFVLFVIVVAIYIRYGALFTIPFFFLAAWLMCLLSMFAPACVIEYLEPLGSLFRSSILTRGCRLKIAGLYLVCLLFGMLSAFIFSILSGFLIDTFSYPTINTIGQLYSAIPIAFLHVTTAVIYYELLLAKEGCTLDDLENVIFDSVDYAN